MTLSPYASDRDGWGCMGPKKVADLRYGSIYFGTGRLWPPS